MDLKNLPLVMGRLFLFIVQILIVIACAVYIQIVYNNDILPDKEVKDNYGQTSCTILSKDLAKVGRVIHRYRSNFLVSYTVNNVAYQSHVTGNGLDQAYFHERGPQEDTLAQFDVGAVYPCWYNPETPQIAVLVLRHDWASTLPLLVPSVIALISIFYLLKGVAQFLGFIGESTRNNKKRYKR